MAGDRDRPDPAAGHPAGVVDLVHLARPAGLDLLRLPRLHGPAHAAVSRRVPRAAGGPASGRRCAGAGLHRTAPAILRAHRAGLVGLVRAATPAQRGAAAGRPRHPAATLLDRACPAGFRIPPRRGAGLRRAPCAGPDAGLQLPAVHRPSPGERPPVVSRLRISRPPRRGRSRPPRRAATTRRRSWIAPGTARRSTAS